MNDYDTIMAAIASGTRLDPVTYNLDRMLTIPEGKFLLGAIQGGRTTMRWETPADKPLKSAVELSNNSQVGSVLVDARRVICNGIVADHINHYAIDDCEVRCAVWHTYSIWSYGSSNGAITNCKIDGMCRTLDGSIPQEGIEVFGGNDVTVKDCRIINMGRGGISFYQESDSGKPCAGARILFDNCDVINCSYALAADIRPGCTLQPATLRNCTLRGVVYDVHTVCGQDAILDLTLDTCEFAKIQSEATRPKWHKITML